MPPGPTSIRRRCLILLLQLLAVVLPIFTASSEALFDARWRAGFRAVLAKGGDVREAELAADYRLPRSYSLGRDWSVETRFQTAIGGIGDDDNTAAIGSLGLSPRLTCDRIPISLMGGCAPTLIGRNRLGGNDLSTAFQFTTHIGQTRHIMERFEAIYRFQHMSNAGVSSHSAGLNAHMAGLSWRF